MDNWQNCKFEKECEDTGGDCPNCLHYTGPKMPLGGMSSLTPGYMPINVVFDGPPSHESGRFVEVETDDGKSIKIGKWIERDDGLWALRIDSLPST